MADELKTNKQKRREKLQEVAAELNGKKLSSSGKTMVVHSTGNSLHVSVKP